MTGVALNLHEWAVNEMKYAGPWSEEMSSLCTGPLADVWKWIIKHCKSKENVKYLLGNVALSRKQHLSGDKNNAYDHGELLERDDLLAHRGKLIGDLHSTLSKIQKLKTLINQLNNDKESVGVNMNKSVKELKERQQRSILLGLYLKQLNLTVSKMNKLSEELENTVHKSFNNDKEEKMYCSRKGITNEADVSVKMALEYGINHMKNVLVDEDESNSGIRYNDVKRLILESVGNVPASSLSDCLIKQTAELTCQIRSKLACKSDINGNDTFVCKEEDYEKDFMSAKSGIANIRVKQISSQLAEHNLASQVAVLEEKAMSMKQNMGNVCDSEEENRLRTKAELSSLRANLDWITSEGDRIEGIVNNDPVVKASRKQQEDIDNLGLVISSLLQSTRSRSLMKDRQKSTIDRMTNDMPQLATQISTMYQSLVDIPSSNFNILGSAPASKLMSTKVIGNNCCTIAPVSHLIINRRTGLLPQNNKPFVKENTTSNLTKLILGVERMKRELDGAESFESAETLIEFLVDLEKNVTHSIREQDRSLGPLLDECDRMRSEAAKTSKRIDNQQQMWRCQPASEVATNNLRWNEVEGRSLNEWVEIVRVYMSRLYNSAS